jgi:hypothetical protein
LSPRAKPVIVAYLRHTEQPSVPGLQITHDAKH